jgi:hypothetical protein
VKNFQLPVDSGLGIGLELKPVINESLSIIMSGTVIHDKDNFTVWFDPIITSAD